jgi:hypothetical protein
MGDMHQLAPLVAKQIAAKLTDLQGERTDAQMGALLGITRVSWLQIRTGRRAISYTVAKRAAAHFPDVNLIVIRDWMPALTAEAS